MQNNNRERKKEITDILQGKGGSGEVPDMKRVVDELDKHYYGKIEGIDELVGWQCGDAKDIVGEYQDLVDMYESNWLKRQDKNDDCI